jgi:hypothetical protein
MVHRCCPAPSPKLVQLKSVGPLAQHPHVIVQLALPPAVERPHLDGRPVRPRRVVVRGGGHRSSRRATRAMSTDPPASRIGRPAHP